jgi:CBS domain-containing protein
MENLFNNVLNAPVETCMRTNIVTVTPDGPVSGLTYQMLVENIGATLVVENDFPVGIITEKDILDRIVIPGLDVHKTLAKEIMSKPVVTVQADMPMKAALDLMKKKSVRRLAVIRNGVLVGLVTERRILEEIGNWII